jgi:hypothetical protein
MPYYQEMLSVFAFAILISVISVLAMFVWALAGVALKDVFVKYNMVFNIAMSLMLVYCAYSVLV